MTTTSSGSATTCKPSDVGIGRDQEVALAPGGGKADTAECRQRLVVGLVDGGVQIAACVPRHRGQQRPIGVIAAGVECDEPPIIRSEKSGNSPDDLIRVESTPDQARRGTYDTNRGGHVAGT